MTSTTSTGRRALTVAFVLVSYRPDAPAGMERATAGLAVGLRSLGHRALILTATPQPRPDPAVIPLGCLPVTFPSDDISLRSLVRAHGDALTAELTAVFHSERVDVAVFVDALWGLGCLIPHIDHPAKKVLAVHVVGHRQDLIPALTADAVITPSPVVVSQAAADGYPTTAWTVVPNPLLIDPDEVTPPEAATREVLRRSGPVRIVARLGPEKGVTDLLRAYDLAGRRVEVAVGLAGFEVASGSQKLLLTECRRAARAAGALLRPPLPWAQVPAFLAGAAVTIVPSLRETFGNVAAESFSAGTPVVAYQVGNLPALVGADAGVVVPQTEGARGLWRAARDLLDDPLRYAEACEAAYCRSRNYRPTTVADVFLKAVWCP